MKNDAFPITYTSLNIIKTKKNKITNKITKNNLLKKEDIKKFCSNKSGICKFKL